MPLAKALDKIESGSYITERFVYCSIDKMPDRLHVPAVKTAGKVATNGGHALRVVADQAWGRWGW